MPLPGTIPRARAAKMLGWSRTFFDQEEAAGRIAVESKGTGARKVMPAGEFLRLSGMDYTQASAQWDTMFPKKERKPSGFALKQPAEKS